MKLFKRAICLVLVLCVCVGMMTGCKETADTNQTGLANDTVVMTLGDYEITADEYLYYFQNFKFSYDSGDDAFWDDTEATVEDIHEQCMSHIRSFYAVIEYADDLGIPLNEEDRAIIEEDQKNVMEISYEGDEEAFKASLEENFLTEEFYHKLVDNIHLARKLCLHLYGDVTRENVICVKHILLQNLQDGESFDSVKEKSEFILEKLENGADFGSMIATYNEDGGQDIDLGYYLNPRNEESDFVEEFTEAAYELEVDEISDLVKSEHGYHILKRYEAQEEYVEDNLYDLIADVDFDDYYENLVPYGEALEANYTDAFEKITLENTRY